MSGLIYERGDPAKPVGHAFLYFGERGDQDVVATYLVVPPINIDLVKYMPPMFASTLGIGAMVPQASFLPIPPVPEPMNLGHILGLAELRGDDILLGGPQPAGADSAALLNDVVQIGEAYAQSYQSIISQPEIEATQVEEPPGPDSPQVRALMYATVGERDRLEALARELGSLRYGLEVGDKGLIDASLTEMSVIADSLPGKYRAKELIGAAAKKDPGSIRLTQLFLDRGYKLASEQYETIPLIEAEIALLQNPGAQEA